MKNWIQRAKQVKLERELQKKKETLALKKQKQGKSASEQDWQERVVQQVLEVSKEELYIRVTRTPNGLQLASEATVDIQFLGHENFAIKYLHIAVPSSIQFNRPITIYHHRLARVRELNEHNIEEILKFVALGMKDYLDIASFQRIEHNLETLIDSVNQEEHFEGPIPRSEDPFR